MEGLMLIMTVCAIIWTLYLVVGTVYFVLTYGPLIRYSNKIFAEISKDMEEDF